MPSLDHFVFCLYLLSSKKYSQLNLCQFEDNFQVALSPFLLSSKFVNLCPSDETSHCIAAETLSREVKWKLYARGEEKKKEKKNTTRIACIHTWETPPIWAEICSISDKEREQQMPYSWHQMLQNEELHFWAWVKERAPTHHCGYRQKFLTHLLESNAFRLESTKMSFVVIADEWGSGRTDRMITPIVFRETPAVQLEDLVKWKLSYLQKAIHSQT